MKTYNNLNRDLTLVQALNLPHWCIAAGYVRNYVWNYLHGFNKPSSLNDVDILYYDPSDTREQTEKNLESILQNEVRDYNWSIKNQARMHERNNEQTYLSVADAMKRWPETATATAITIGKSNKLEVIAPHGLNDLFDLVVRQSPYFKDTDCFHNRVQSKQWLETWPNLKLIVEETQH
ncbi:nucleotidyltransferase family protein [Paenibacillus sp. L3-i20]|uniref:nucleotidyltransferase family protein n=1 Tax=Paenibacillus sp. L3-i20 TaxID=2905833 RepID=UPI0020C00471|nr:nucleotidyltransferase family protein [Paenibacillus sp. L3-i20]